MKAIGRIKNVLQDMNRGKRNWDTGLKANEMKRWRK